MTASQAISAALDAVEGTTGWQIVPAPSCNSVEELIDWLEAHGAGEVRAFIGPDGMWRGFGIIR